MEVPGQSVWVPEEIMNRLMELSRALGLGYADTIKWLIDHAYK